MISIRAAIRCSADKWIIAICYNVVGNSLANGDSSGNTQHKSARTTTTTVDLMFVFLHHFIGFGVIDIDSELIVCLSTSQSSSLLIGR